MNNLSSLLDLPYDIRELIYINLFQGTEIIVDFLPKSHDDIDPDDGSGWPQNPRWWKRPSCNLHSSLSVTFTSKAIRTESLPLFYQHALFNVKRCCSTFIEQGGPILPRKLFERFTHIRGNCEFLLCIGFIMFEWQQSMPLRGSPLHDMPLRDVHIDLSMSRAQIKNPGWSGHGHYVSTLRDILTLPRNFSMTTTLTLCAEDESLTSTLRILNNNTIIPLHPPRRREGYMLMLHAMKVLRLSPPLEPDVAEVEVMERIVGEQRWEGEVEWFRGWFQGL